MPRKFRVEDFEVFEVFVTFIRIKCRNFEELQRKTRGFKRLFRAINSELMYTVSLSSHFIMKTAIWHQLCFPAASVLLMFNSPTSSKYLIEIFLFLYIFT